MLTVMIICNGCKAENDDAAESCFTCGRSMAPTKGSWIGGRYEILECLGRGGMGTVYKAHDRTLDDMVALKVLRPDFARIPEIADRFRSEIKLARRIAHPNVCRIYEYGEDGGLRYISMEFIDGVDLRQRVWGTGLPHDTAFEVSIQVARGLQAIHDAGIIHRDLKTSNILWDKDGVVRLMDFGIAKRFMGDGRGEGTAVGQILGTPEYMSPEQASGEKLDFRSDVYALGIVIFEIFTGHVPFKGDTPVATMLKHLQEPPPLEAPEAAAIPRGLLPVLARALAKPPAARYATARGVIEGLRLARGAALGEGWLGGAPAPESDHEPGALEPGPLGPAPAAAPAAALPPGGEEAVSEPPAPTETPQSVKDRVRDLILVLQHPDVRLRWRGALALWEIGPAAEEAIPALTAALEDEAASVAEAAAQAIKRIRPASPTQALSGATPGKPSTTRIGLGALTDALRHPQPAVRNWAAARLMDLGPEAAPAVPALIEYLADAGGSVRDWAAMALGNIGPAAAPAVPALTAALSDQDPLLRGAVAHALGAIGPSSRAAVPALAAALRDGEASVRLRAAEALGEIGRAAAEAVPFLMAAREDREVAVASGAATALEKIIGTVEPTPAPTQAPTAQYDLPPAIARLLEAFRADAADARWRAVAALAAMDAVPAQAVGPLCTALEDADQSVRLQAAKALGLVGRGAKDAVPALVAALNQTEDSLLRARAAAALGSIGAEARSAIPALIGALRASDATEADETAQALARIGKLAVPALIEALQDENARIRLKAAQVLTRIAAER